MPESYTYPAACRGQIDQSSEAPIGLGAAPYCGAGPAPPPDDTEVPYPASLSISLAYPMPAPQLSCPALYAASAFQTLPPAHRRRYVMKRIHALAASPILNGDPIPHAAKVPGSNCSHPSAPAYDTTYC